MAASGKQVGGRVFSYLTVRRGRPPASYGSGHSTTKRYAEQTEIYVDTLRQQSEKTAWVLQQLGDDARAVASRLQGMQPRSIPVPSALAEWINAVESLMQTFQAAARKDSGHVPQDDRNRSLLRTALAFQRRKHAEDVSETQRFLHDGTVGTHLEQEYAWMDELLSGALRAIEPVARPRLAHYLTASGLIRVDRVRDLSEPAFEAKHRILLDASALVHDLAVYREHCDSRGASLAVVFADLDDFKQLNSKLGEVTVDRVVLPPIMSAVENSAYGHGRAYRHGGDEFVLLLPNADLPLAEMIAQRMASAIERVAMPSGLPAVRVSVGVWITHPESHLTGAELIHFASVAKSKAKAAGKGQVMSFVELSSELSEFRSPA